MKTRGPIYFTLVLLLAGGCASKKLDDWPSAYRHVIAVDSKGVTRDPREWTNRDPDEKPLECHLDSMFKEIRAWPTTKPTDPDHANDPPVRRVLVFVHGGMNDPIDALNRSRGWNCQMGGDGNFPIFVVWDSNLESSYAEHLAYVRRGVYDEKRVWLWPFYLFSDVGRAIARAPIVWEAQVENDLDRLSANARAAPKGKLSRIWLDNPQFRQSITMTRELITRYKEHPDQNIHISMGVGHTDGGGGWWRVASYFLMAPVKFGVSPILDSTGSAAWDNMFRRTHIMFDGFSSNSLTSRNSELLPETILERGPGPLERLIARLAKIAPADGHAPEDGGPPVEITVVGHSMGSIVLNEFLRRADTVKVKNIVYLAAACSVRDFSKSVVPYLVRHRDTLFFNLCLNPANDMREMHAHEIPPRGSLLVWVDDMFANPLTPLDRTLGRWDNLPALASVIPPEQRRQVRLRACDFATDETTPYPLGNGIREPQQHGQFSDVEFWHWEFWQPAKPDVALSKIKEIADEANKIETQIKQNQSRENEIRQQREQRNVEQFNRQRE